MNGKSPRNLTKDIVRCMKKDFAMRGSKLLAVMAIRFKLAKIMCFGQYDMNDVSLEKKSWY